MNPSLAWLLTRLYPRPWRERYGAEFEELLETGHGGVRILANVVWSGLRERIFPIQGLTPDHATGSVAFHSFCMRAPWVIFSVAPVFLLAGGYFVACLILWAGWKIFLPGADSPFGGWPPARVRESLFSIRQIFLRRRANPGRLGHRNHSCSSKSESSLALDRLHSRRMDGGHGTD
jgi:hypothetical protein